MALALAALRLLRESLSTLKAFIELLRSLHEEEAHPARRSPPKHLKREGRRR